MNYQSIKLDLNSEECKMFCGEYDCNIHLLSELYNASISLRDSEIKLFSDDKELYISLSAQIAMICRYIRSTGEAPDDTLIRQTFNDVIRFISDDWRNENAGYTFSGKPIRFRTYSQYLLYKTISDNDITFSIGPAGTGKTFLSVLMACKGLKKGDYRKIILSRPAVEAGESLGFLPGDLKEKVDPYLMPLYDSLNEILGEEQVEKLIEKKVIEVVPLAYIRGRTFSNACVILDEAQNTTDRQMLMFLTRIGQNAKMIINGDITQIDLNISRNRSGLVSAMEKLRDIKRIGFVEFLDSDVVRNPLIEKIIKRFSI